MAEINTDLMISILRTPERLRTYEQQLHIKFNRSIMAFNASVGDSDFLVDRDGTTWRWLANEQRHDRVYFETSDDGYQITPYNKTGGGTGIIGQHQLVAIAYLGYFRPGWRPGIRCPQMLVVDHISGNKLDNRLENLRVISQGDNLKNLPWTRN